MSESEGEQDPSAEIREEIKQLRHRRGTIKSKFTKFETFLNATKNHSELIQIDLRVKNIEQSYEEFETLQTRLEYLDPNDKERDLIEENYFALVSKAKTLIAKQTKPSVAPVATNSGQSQGQHSTVNVQSTAKLPDITLPKFHGSYETWLSFYDIFNSVVHARTDLTDTQKFLYLKSCCKDDALKLIDSLDVTEDNYKIAREQLTKRYENKRVITNHHINNLLFNLPQASRDSHSSLRKLIDTVSQNLSVLKKLGLPTEYWDDLILALVVKKLDNHTKRDWEAKVSSLDKTTKIKWSTLSEFLTNKCLALEFMQDNNESIHRDKAAHFSKPPQETRSNNSTSGRTVQSYIATQTLHCLFCSGKHFIYQCADFIKLSLAEKYNEIKKLNLCSNCLRSGHFKYDCQSGNCKKCSRKHNTILHIDNTPRTNETTVEQVETQASTAQTNTVVNASNVCSLADKTIHQVLLSTAKIIITDDNGKDHLCTALLDSGSQSNLITYDLCKRLNLKLSSISLPLAGVNDGITTIENKTSIKIKSRVSEFSTRLSCLVLPKITEDLPLIAFDKHQVQYPNDIPLADESFNIPKHIDLLIGADIFFELLRQEDRIKVGKGSLALQNTVFGWIFTGGLTVKTRKNKVLCNKITNPISWGENLNENLQLFWATEELPNKTFVSKETEKCETYFKQTTTRDESGRFIVRLPFDDDKNKELGESKTICLKRLSLLETRLNKDEQLKADYTQFLESYESLNHMSFKCNLDEDISTESESYFMPHHAVYKDSTTTKCRVVFDASCKTSTNVSLNDKLLVGPKLQDELFSIVLRMRLHEFVLSADIKMMFRQIWIHPHDRAYQKILWRSNNTEPIKIYELNTVTYGTASASYLATKCLQELADQNSHQYPRCAEIIKNSFYMDDLLVSAPTVTDALQIYNELNSILLPAGFQLRKWLSNEKSITETISADNSNEDQFISDMTNKELKTLGIKWNPVTDKLAYSINIAFVSARITKRVILSIIAQIFDPLGLIGPATIKAKILMQQLWIRQIDWDQTVPDDMLPMCSEFISQIKHLNNITIDRHNVCKGATTFELHGFSDASEKAYGACLYLYSENAKGEKQSRLLCAKSKVAPIKKLTLPRLELLAAVLLARLLKTIQEIITLDIHRTRLYCDSKIVLAWTRIEPCLLKQFVANRVSVITELTNVNDWSYVKSSENAADIISRGIDPVQLENLTLWWHGPSFLLENNVQYCNLPEDQDILDIPETIPVSHIAVQSNTNIIHTESNIDIDIFKRYSNLTKLQRVIAYILRFKNIASKQSRPNTNLILTVSELENALNILIKLSQAATFQREITLLQQGQKINANSRICNLNPYLDSNGILRVGGRLLNASVPLEQRHPIILSPDHVLTKLIVKHEHYKNLHAGPQLLLSVLSLKYWPVNGLRIIKKILRSCVICFRTKPKHPVYLMGEFPAARVNQNRPFSQCGLDYAGPIMVKEGTLRNSKFVKGYICVFVCMVTRAIHLELVMDLTTLGFLNALKRFISRRGKPADVFSDNGSNFIGANNYFIELYNLLSKESHNEEVSNFLGKDNINWHFNPSKAPHMGGIWEAAVKSVKYHLRRTLKDASVNYCELYTILTQIEGCLNSRPITAFSNHPDDFLPLTPAHFLIGDSLAAPPDRQVEETRITRLSRYERMQLLVQTFWHRWSTEYLSSLQKRTKWLENPESHIRLGDLVILVEDNLPPFRWPMARVIQLHPGTDKVLRVVTVRLPNGNTTRRSTHKLCPLPREEDF